MPFDRRVPQDWKDERLTWDKEISDLTEIVIDGSTLWKPEFAIINGYVAIFMMQNHWLILIYGLCQLTKAK